MDNIILPSSLPQDNITYPPKIVGHFSISADGEIRQDLSQLPRLRDANDYMDKQLDLNEGYESRVERRNLNGNLDGILTWIIKHKEFREQVEQSNFVCTRGVLRYLMMTPYYEQNYRITIKVMRWKDIIFLSHHKERNEQYFMDHSKFIHWGQRFEKYLTEKAAIEDSGDVTDQNEDFRAVYIHKLGGIKLLYEGEIDCYSEPEGFEPSPSKFVELKTCRKGLKEKTMRNKMLDWWAQCQLSNIPRLIVGWRDAKGFVDEVEDIKVSSLPKGKEWKPEVCKTYLKKILNFLQWTVTENSLTDVYDLRMIFINDQNEECSGAYAIEATDGSVNTPEEPPTSVTRDSKSAEECPENLEVGKKQSFNNTTSKVQDKPSKAQNQPSGRYSYRYKWKFEEGTEPFLPEWFCSQFN